MNQPSPKLTVRLGISGNFHNKDNRAKPRRNAKTGEESTLYAFSSFSNVVWTTRQIIVHVLRGNAISVGSTRDTHRHSSKFVSSQIMGVDFDNGLSVQQLAQDELAGGYAFLIYATPSSTPENPRCRALFALDLPIVDADKRRVLNKRLLAYYQQIGEEADKACKDPVRIFFGSETKDYLDNPDAFLPLSILEAMPRHPDELAAEYASQRREQWLTERLVSGENPDHDRNYALKALQSESDKMARTSDGERHDQNFKSAFAMGQLVGAGALDANEAYRAIFDAALSAGRNRADAERTTHDGLTAGQNNPRVIPPPRANPERTKNVIDLSASPVNAQEESMAIPYQSPVVMPVGEPVKKFTFSEFIVTGAQADELFQQDIDPDSPATGGAPVIVPFAPLHKFGGFAKLIQTGKMVGIAAQTGGNKTIFLETIIDAYLLAHESVLVWSPEWSPSELAQRRAARYGGLPLERIMEHQAAKWYHERDLRVPFGDIRRLTRDEYDACQTASLASIPALANAYYIKKKRLSLDDLLDGIENTVNIVRENGEDLRVIILDYAQMLKINARDKRGRTLQDAIGEIKDLCCDLGLVAWVASQVTKDDSRSKNEGKLLDENSAQFLRFDEFNLALTLHMNFYPDDAQPQFAGKHDGTATIYVAKNNLGKRGLVTVLTDLGRLAWTQETTEPREWHPTNKKRK